jgi:hypothetical protein
MCKEKWDRVAWKWMRHVIYRPPGDKSLNLHATRERCMSRIIHLF